jgi:hypothetical protein
VDQSGRGVRPCRPHLDGIHPPLLKNQAGVKAAHSALDEIHPEFNGGSFNVE